MPRNDRLSEGLKGHNAYDGDSRCSRAAQWPTHQPPDPQQYNGDSLPFYLMVKKAVLPFYSTGRRFKVPLSLAIFVNCTFLLNVTIFELIFT